MHATCMYTRKGADPNEHLHACPRIYRDNCVYGNVTPCACNTWYVYTSASTRICPTCTPCAHTHVRNYEPIPMQGAHMCAYASVHARTSLSHTHQARTQTLARVHACVPVEHSLYIHSCAAQATLYTYVTCVYQSKVYIHRCSLARTWRSC